MAYLSLSPKQFRAAFRTEKQCRAYLFKLKHPDGFKCVKCAHSKHHEIEHRDSWQCAECGYQESAKAGTIFHKSKVSLVNWFQAILELTIGKGGISAVELQERLGFGSYKTAWGLLHKIRRAMAQREADRPMVSGRVEIDGVIIGRRATGNQGHAYFAIEVKKNREGKECAGRLRAGSVVKFRRDEAIAFSDENIESGTQLVCDGGHDLANLDLYRPVEIESLTMSRQSGLHKTRLLWINRTIGNFKSSLTGVYHGISVKYLDAYLAEYSYRFNRRSHRRMLQSRLLQACASFGPVTFADISA